ncbi:hypothetical protein Tco_1123525 [Tanacetum coccineum]|uniref:Uncharacterized protein n=1 Tax=Tanacetum coccineum TaxID=301880 RepID=A0ABQ5J3M7_9ASTR
MATILPRRSISTRPSRYLLSTLRHPTITMLQCVGPIQQTMLLLREIHIRGFMADALRDHDPVVARGHYGLGEGIKARLDRHKGRWVEELSSCPTDGANLLIQKLDDP